MASVLLQLLLGLLVDSQLLQFKLSFFILLLQLDLLSSAGQLQLKLLLKELFVLLQVDKALLLQPLLFAVKLGLLLPLEGLELALVLLLELLPVLLEFLLLRCVLARILPLVLLLHLLQLAFELAFLVLLDLRYFAGQLLLQITLFGLVFGLELGLESRDFGVELLVNFGLLLVELLQILLFSLEGALLLTAVACSFLLQPALLLPLQLLALVLEVGLNLLLFTLEAALVVRLELVGFLVQFQLQPPDLLLLLGL